MTKKTTSGVEAEPPVDTWSLPPEAMAAASYHRTWWRHVRLQASPSVRRSICGPCMAAGGTGAWRMPPLAVAAGLYMARAGKSALQAESLTTMI
jgi:hypothetical protein